MAIGRGQISAQIDGKLRGARKKKHPQDIITCQMVGL